MCPTFPSLLPIPRLTLKLSNSTILDTILLDARDATPLFTIETVGNQTALYHTATATANGPLSHSHVAAVHWPASNQKHQKKQKDAIVFIDAQTVPSSVFLRKSVLGGSRKFHVPGQSHPLKWKHVGSHWECTLCSHACTAHRAVATYEPAHTTSTARLNVYADTVVSSRTYAETGIHAQYDGVDMDMLAYLVLTSMLLTTQPHAWQDLNTNTLPLTEKYTTQTHHQLHLAPMITTSSPSTSSYKAPRIDLLSDDLSHSPPRGSPTSQSSSCCSSLPPSPLTPNMDLSPIHHDTFGSFAPGASSSSTHSNSNNSCTGAGTGTNTPNSSVFRRNSRNSNRMPSPLITCSTFSNSSSSSSPTTATPNTPAGPSAITPYHLPPAPCPSTPTTPHSLHPHHSHALPHHSHSSTHHSHHHHHHHHHNHTQQQQQQQQRSHTNNALHLDTSHAVVVASPVLPYTTQMYNIQFAGEAPIQPPSNQQQQQVQVQVQVQVANDELPPAYNEIEWTVRVKQPRTGGPRPLRVQ